MITIEELRALQQENLETDEWFWDRLRGFHEVMIADHKGLVEHAMAATEAQANSAATSAAAAKASLPG